MREDAYNASMISGQLLTIKDNASVLGLSTKSRIPTVYVSFVWWKAVLLV